MTIFKKTSSKWLLVEPFVIGFITLILGFLDCLRVLDSLFIKDVEVQLKK